MCPKLAKRFDEPLSLGPSRWGSSCNALPEAAPPSDDDMGDMEGENGESEDGEDDAIVDPKDLGLKF